MAYAERIPNRNKTLAVITVAGLHGVALYGLVTGLGVNYVKEAVTVLVGHNEPVEIPPPPPPPEPTPVEQVATRNPKQIANPPSFDAARNEFAKSDILVEIPIGPVAPARIDPILPFVQPTPDKPAFTPKSARPRGNPGAWVSTSDYPGASLRRGEQGVVRFEVGVGTDGRVSDCRVTLSSGSADLDAATCKFVAKRANFEPATDNTGARVMGTYSGSIRWLIPTD